MKTDLESELWSQSQIIHLNLLCDLGWATYPIIHLKLASSRSPLSCWSPSPVDPFIKISFNLSMPLDPADRLSSLGFSNAAFLVFLLPVRWCFLFFSSLFTSRVGLWCSVIWHFRWIWVSFHGLPHSNPQMQDPNLYLETQNDRLDLFPRANHTDLNTAGPTLN